jgi:hypothetical protein
MPGDRHYRRRGPPLDRNKLVELMARIETVTSGESPGDVMCAMTRVLALAIATAKSRPEKRVHAHEVVAPAPTTADRAGRLTLAGLRAAVAMRKALPGMAGSPRD